MKTDIKTFFIHCGNYKHFEVDAFSKAGAKNYFCFIAKISEITHGFAEKDITAITEKEGKK